MTDHEIHPHQWDIEVTAEGDTPLLPLHIIPEGEDALHGYSECQCNAKGFTPGEPMGMKIKHNEDVVQRVFIENWAECPLSHPQCWIVIHRKIGMGD